MKSILSISFFLLSLLGFAVDVSAQAKEVEELWKNQLDTGRTNLIKPVYLEISEEKILELFNKQPSFGMYHDNYFITGIPLNKEINKHTADAKFQISIRQRLTKTVLPFNSFLMLTYRVWVTKSGNRRKLRSRYGYGTRLLMICRISTKSFEI